MISYIASQKIIADQNQQSQSVYKNDDDDFKMYKKATSLPYIREME